MCNLWSRIAVNGVAVGDLTYGAPGETKEVVLAVRNRRRVRSRTLARGCLVGVYELFNAKSVAVIDDKAKECDAHRNGRICAMSSG
jgi:hypothetical protein